MGGPRNATWLPRWRLKTEGVIAPDERLPWGQTVAVGLQHLVAMFGATVLAPLLMGFDPNVAVLFSGVATLVFFACVDGRVPSYLGSSFSFIAVVIAVTGYSGQGPNPNLGVALGGIWAAGAVYALIGALVATAGHGWIERLMPPVVTGAVVAVIGLNLAPIAVKNVSGGALDGLVALVTVATLAATAVYAPGSVRRVPILLGGAAGYLAYIGLANGLGLGRPIDFGPLVAAPWFGMPRFATPEFSAGAVALIAPVALVLVAENLGHIKAVAAMTGRNLDGVMGRAFIGDGVATMISASGGGTGVTTYAENIGVMAVTKIYSSLAFLVAAAFAVVLGFCPKFGALVLTIPTSVIGGLAIIVFGLIAVTAGRIWVESRVDFTDPRNLITAGAALTAGAGDLTLTLFGWSLGGIGTATFGCIALYHLLGLKK